jgi:hypothetical protein
MGNNLPNEKEAVDQIELPPKRHLLLQDLEDIRISDRYCKRNKQQR